MEQGGYKVHHKECVTIKSLLTKESFKEREYVFYEDIWNKSY